MHSSYCERAFLNFNHSEGKHRMTLLRNPRVAASLLTTVAVLLSGLAFASPANAAQSANNPPSPSTIVTGSSKQVQLTAQQTMDANAIFAATNYTTRRFDAVAALAAGASSSAVADAAAVAVTEGLTVVGPLTAKPSASVQTVVAAAAKCTGKNGYHGFYAPWGYQFGANSCNTQKLAQVLALGAAGSGAIAVILGAIGVTAAIVPVTAVIAALLGFGSAAIATCAVFSSNGGIWINVLGTPPASCWGQ